MSRLPLPEESARTPRQQEVIDLVTNGPRGGVRGPFGAWIRSPEMAVLAQELGAHVRYRSCLSDQVREIVICQTAKSLKAQYEWFAHCRIALEAGVDAAAMEAIRKGERPKTLPADQMAAFETTEELTRTKHLSDASYAKAVAAFGEEGTVEIVAAVGYYTLVGLTLNVANVALPEGEPLPFPD